LVRLEIGIGKEEGNYIEEGNGRKTTEGIQRKESMENEKLWKVEGKRKTLTRI
jgi:hypothetical protein